MSTEAHGTVNLITRKQTTPLCYCSFGKYLREELINTETQCITGDVASCQNNGILQVPLS